MNIKKMEADGTVGQVVGMKVMMRTRFVWPPPGCMCEGRSAGAQGFCFGKCGGALAERLGDVSLPT